MMRPIVANGLQFQGIFDETQLSNKFRQSLDFIMEFDPGRWFKKTKGDPELNDLILKFIQYNFTNQYVGLKSLPAMQEIWVQSLGWEDPLEKGKATHSSILAWRIPWTV